MSNSQQSPNETPKTPASAPATPQQQTQKPADGKPNEQQK
jgi:hypothetical protein